MKTAEEMLHEEFNVSTANGLVHTPPEFIISVMNRFAAQEVAKDVETYKKRLRGALNALPAGLVNRAEFHKIIDTVK